MSKKNNKNGNQPINEDSLVNKYENIFNEYEKLGQDITGAFEQFGGKDAFLQYIQDIEDDVAGDKSEIFKRAYSDGDIRRCVRLVVNMFKDDWFLYKRGLKRCSILKGIFLRIH